MTYLAPSVGTLKTDSPDRSSAWIVQIDERHVELRPESFNPAHEVTKLGSEA